MSECPVCKATQVRKIRTLKGSRTGRGNPLYICLDCFSLYQRPGYHLGDDETLRADLSWHLDELAIHRKHSESIVRQLLDLNPNARTLLDIGCGIGASRAVAERVGLDYQGVEPNPYCVNYAKTVLSLDLMQAYFKADLFSDRFDLVIADMVLEHVVEPSAFVADVFSILSPGGLFFLSVPGRRGGVLRVIYSLIFPRAKYSLFLDNDVHINHFSRTGIMRLIAQNGAVLRAELSKGTYVIQAKGSE
jgi:2-polyprenyl-3-methyl-5-hydroxy-6-metoxy-1,4-benzoquinol methylase